MKCGSYAKAVEDHKSTMQNLSSSCPTFASKGGREVLDRLKRGIPPRAGTNWPAEADHSPLAMSNEALEALWPDLRGAKRKKRPRPKTEEDENANRKVLVQADPAEGSQGEGDDDVVFNEDEDPWHERS